MIAPRSRHRAVHGGGVEHAGLGCRVPAVPGCYVRPELDFCAALFADLFHSVEEEGEYEEEVPAEEEQ